MKNSVLIVGSRGQLGEELLKSIPAELRVEAVDFDELDICDGEAVKTFIAARHPGLLINAAAYTAVDKAESEPDKAFAVNAGGLSNLAAAMAAHGGRLIHISTDYVFDGRNCRPYLPEDTCDPQSVYGRSKFAGETELQRIMPGRHVIIRTAWLYSSHHHNFMRTMLKLMAERERLTVVCDQLGTPTAATGLARTVWGFAAKEAACGLYHWTDAGCASWYDFAVAIREEAIGRGLLSPSCAEVVPVPGSAYPTPARRPHYSVLDKSSSYQELGLAPVHWRVMLRGVLDELNI